MASPAHPQVLFGASSPPPSSPPPDPSSSAAPSAAAPGQADISPSPWTVDRISSIPLSKLGHEVEESYYEHDHDSIEASTWTGAPPAAVATSGGWTAVLTLDSSSIAATATSSFGSRALPGTSPRLQLTAWYRYPVAVETGATSGLGGAATDASDTAEDAEGDDGTTQRFGTSPVTPVVRVTRTLAWPPKRREDDGDDPRHPADGSQFAQQLRLAVEIAVVPGNMGIVRAYAAHPITGDVMAWSLPLLEDEAVYGGIPSTQHHDDTLNPDALVKLPVNSEGMERITSLDVMTTTTTTAPDHLGSSATASVVAPVAIGTSWGHVYWIQRTTNPVTLQAWRVDAASSSSSSSSDSSSSAAGAALAGLFQMSSWFSPAPKPKKPRLSPPLGSSFVPSPPHRPVPMTGPPRYPASKGGSTSASTSGPDSDLSVVRAILLADVSLPTGVTSSSSSSSPRGGTDGNGLLVIVRRRAIEVWNVHGLTSYPTFRCTLRTNLPKQWELWVKARSGDPQEDASLYDGLLGTASHIVEATSEGFTKSASSSAHQDKHALHVLVKSADRDGESLYWVTVDVLSSAGESIRSVVPLQQGTFLHLPPNHTWVCRGIQASEDGTKYVCLWQTGRRPSQQHTSNDSNDIVPVIQHRSIILAIGSDDESRSTTASSPAIHTFDLLAAGVGALLAPIQLDVASPGCVLYTTSGDQLLVQFVRSAATSIVVDASLAIDLSVVERMVQCLRDTVRDLLDDPFHFPNGVTLTSLSKLLPTPKTTTADSSSGVLAHVELAVLQLSRLELHRNNPYDPDDEVQARMTPASAYSKLERHESLVVLLQRGGLYRALSVPVKVELFATGQQLKVFAALIGAGSDSSPRSERMSHFTASLASPLDLDDWFDEMQSASVKGAGGAPDLGLTFAELICESITAAATYKSSRLQSLFGVSDGNVRQMLPTTPLWPCRPHFQRLLHSQLRIWMSEPPVGLNTAIGSMFVETIVVRALQSFRDLYDAANRSQAAEMAYAEIQDIAISVLERLASSDELAWRLSVEHSYFRGLCAIARRHEHLKDRDLYQLEPLFKHFNGKSSAGEPGIPFCHFVLDWHAKESLLGHVLEYGKRCPGALRALLEGNREYENLRQFQWIHSIRNGDFDKSAESLLSNAKNQDCTVADVKVDLALATLSNRLAARSTFVADRRADIASLRELIAIQDELFDMDNDAGVENQRVLSPEELLQVVFDKVSSRLSADTSVDGTARLLLLGLCACTALNSTTDIQRRACQVWQTAIERDQEWLTKTLEGSASTMLSQSTEMVELLRERTVFGSLLRQFANREVSGTRLWRQVSYPSVEKQVRSTLPSTTLAKGLATLASVTSAIDAGGM